MFCFGFLLLRMFSEGSQGTFSVWLYVKVLQNLWGTFPEMISAGVGTFWNILDLLKFFSWFFWERSHDFQQNFLEPKADERRALGLDFGVGLRELWPERLFKGTLSSWTSAAKTKELQVTVRNIQTVFH